MTVTFLDSKLCEHFIRKLTRKMAQVRTLFNCLKFCPTRLLQRLSPHFAINHAWCNMRAQ